MRATCREAGAPIVTGDTKVMGRGELDGIVINTTGVALTDRVVRDCGPRGRATGSSSPARSATTASRSWRRATSSALEGDSALRRRAAQRPDRARRSRAGGDGVVGDEGPDARRPRERAPRDGRQERRRHRARRARAAGDATRCAPRPSCSASIRCIVANEGKAVIGVRPERADARARGAARAPARPRRRDRRHVHRPSARARHPRHRLRPAAARRARGRARCRGSAEGAPWTTSESTRRSDGAVGVLTIDRRERFNSLDVRDRARPAQGRAPARARPRACARSCCAATGGVFCSGADLKYIRAGGDADGPRVPRARARAATPPATARSSSRSSSTSTAPSPRSGARRSRSSPRSTAPPRRAGSGSRWRAISSSPPSARRSSGPTSRPALTGAESSTFLLPRLVGLAPRDGPRAARTRASTRARRATIGLVSAVFPDDAFDARGRSRSPRGSPRARPPRYARGQAPA